MEELGEDIASVSNRRSFYSSGFGQHFNRPSSGAAVYSLSEGPNVLNPDCFSPFVSFPRSAASASNQITFGCPLASSCYTCKAPPSSAFQQSATGNVGCNPTNKPDTVGFSRAALRCDEVPGRVRELGVYQGYTGSYPYSRISQRVRARDQRLENPFAVEGYQPWNWSGSWSGQVYCPKEQSEGSHIWKPSLTVPEDTVLPRADTRRARKKRVPYTKLQLKELEHEYNITKFITKERRRRIASSTNLSERQVTIWFQNRRVKDKKIISKITKEVEPYQ